MGVELEDGSGKHDGAVKGQRYFQCSPGNGMFIRPAAVIPLEDQATPKPAKATNGRANGAATQGKPPRMSTAGGVKRQSIMDPAAGKRNSVNAGSPTPAARPAGVSRLAVGVSLERTKVL